MDERKTPLQELLADLNRVTELSLELSQRTRPILEDQLREQLEEAVRKHAKPSRSETDHD